MAINAVTVAPDQLVAEATRLKKDGWRFVTCSSVEIDAENMEVLYHFDKDLKLTNLRTAVKKGGHLPSISGVYFCAFLVENEIRDQFGLFFDGLVLDYQGKLLYETAHTAQNTPWCRYHVVQTKKEVQ